jgi:hypothetical protein
MQSTDVAVLDPPWYNPFYKLFIWAALTSLRVGGYLFLSFPPSGTRPSAADDLAEVLMWSQNVGLSHLRTVPHALPYRSPLFEVNALRAEGLLTVPLDWRHGDLVIFRRQYDVRSQKPVISCPKPAWAEYQIGIVRIKIRCKCELATSGELVPVWRRAVLPSVSSRFPKRSQANVVTMGNRFYHSDSPELVSAILSELKMQESHKSKTPPKPSRQSHGDLSTRLKRLISVERREAENYLQITCED